MRRPRILRDIPPYYFGVTLAVSIRQVLHAWRRELYELLPYLRATEVKCGWLYKKGETSSAGFKKRYCVLFSSYRLLYFESEVSLAHQLFISKFVIRSGTAFVHQ